MGGVVGLTGGAAEAVPSEVPKTTAEGPNAPNRGVLSGHDADFGEQERLLGMSKPMSRAQAPPYANRAFLSQYIAAVDPENPRADTLRVRMAKRRTMLGIHVILALTILAANIAAMMWAMKSHPPDSRGVGTISFGDCSTVNNINGIVHLMLNVVSSLFLGAGNYCMQILAAPSRLEIDRAHAKGISLEIGTPSIKNLWHIRRRRTLAWMLIGIFATILHLFWNSTIFASFAYVSYPRATVTSDFLEASDDWSTSNPLGVAGESTNSVQNASAIYALQRAAKTLTRLDRMDCMNSFINPLNGTRSLIVVTLNHTSAQNNGSSLIFGKLSGLDPLYWSQLWICTAHENSDYSTWCTAEWASTFIDDWATCLYDAVENPGIPIDYCLVGEAGDNSQRCAFQYSAYLWITVCVCTFCESLLIVWTWLSHRENTMLTIGDAISDFLKRPDVAESGHSDSVAERPVVVAEVPWVTVRNLPWFKVISTRTWIVTLVVFLLGTGAAAVLLGVALYNLNNGNSDLGGLGIANLGFGLNTREMVAERLWPSSNKGLDLLEKLLFANAFQLILSFGYIFYNNILTRQLIADEWTRFLRPEGKKSLRVSSPVGMQRSSYMLSLPMTYSVPLLVSFMILHYLISQSIFIAQADAFQPGPATSSIPDFNKSEVGYSVLGIIISLSLWIFLVAALLINSAARYYRDVPASFPAMATSSLALGAVCQPPRDDNEAYLFELRLGVVRDEDGTPHASGRLTFSTSIYAQKPEAGVVYQQPILNTRKPSRMGEMKIATT